MQDKLSLQFILGMEDTKMQQLALLSSFNVSVTAEGSSNNGVGFYVEPQNVGELGFELSRTTEGPAHSIGSVTYLPTGKYF